MILTNGIAMLHLGRLMTLLLLMGGTPALAQNHPVVVEMYTSQGCSSCPPADAFFDKHLAERDDVIALALHVDYWDYIGWKDEFASPDYTKRQKAYARVAGHRSVYTPQMIVGGVDHVVGTHPEEVKALIRKHQSLARKVAFSIERKGNKLHIRAKGGAVSDEMEVHLVRYRPSEEVAIRRGENAGKSVRYANIVDSWDSIVMWNGRKDLNVTAPVRGKAPVVAILQVEGNGPILAAARLR